MRSRLIHLNLQYVHPVGGMCLAIIAAVLALGGCASDQSRRAGADLSDASQSTAASTQPYRPTSKSQANEQADGDELADRIQQDVNAFLEMQDQSGEQTGANDSTPTQGTDQQNTSRRTASKPPKIIWNDPQAESAKPKESSASSSSNKDENNQQPADTSRSNDESDSGAAQSDDADETSPPELQAPADEPNDEYDAPEDPRIRQLLVELSRALYRESTYDDMPLRQLMVISATTMVSPDRALQVDALSGLTDRERELLSAFQDFFVALGKDLDGSQPAELVLTESVRELQRAITRQPQLKIPTLRLCTEVNGFADYEEFEPYRFLAHSEQQAVVYTEVDEFSSEMNDNGEWVTELSQQLTIYSHRDGIPVWQLDWQPAVDRSRKKRQDFFITQVITLPDALGVGKYNLKVRLRDEKSGAEAGKSIPFELVADPKLAAEVNK